MSVSLENTGLAADSKLLRVCDAAKHMSSSRSNLYKLMDTGVLPYVKIGKSRRITVAAIEKLIQDSTVGGN